MVGVHWPVNDTLTGSWESTRSLRGRPKPDEPHKPFGSRAPGVARCVDLGLGHSAGASAAPAGARAARARRRTLALSQTWNMFAPDLQNGRILVPELRRVCDCVTRLTSMSCFRATGTSRSGRRHAPRPFSRRCCRPTIRPRCARWWFEWRARRPRAPPSACSQ